MKDCLLGLQIWSRWWSGGHENLTEAGLKEKKDFSGRVQGLRLCASKEFAYHS